MPVPYTFGTATAAIPLSQLDSNFATAVTIGNTAVQLGNTVTTLNNLTLANVTISSGNVTITNVAVTTANVSGTANVSSLVVLTNETVLGNTAVTGNVTASINVTGAKLIPTGTSVTGNGLYLPAANALGLSTNGTNAVYIDASQNVGIGTASPATKLQVAGEIRNSSDLSNSGDPIVYSYNGASAGTVQAGIQFVGSGQNIRAYTAGAERMRIDSSGNVGIGTSSPNGKLNVQGTTGNSVFISQIVGATNNPYLTISHSESGSYSKIDANGSTTAACNLVFSTIGSERARIDSSGNLLVGVTSVGAGGASIFSIGSNNANPLQIQSSNASTPYGAYINFSAAAPNNTTQYFLSCNDSGGSRAVIRANGGLANYSANNVNLSDRREKTNFAPAKSYLDIICAIPVQTFNYIDQNLEEDDGLNLGVVAQDVQAVAPELVIETNWADKNEEPKMRLSIYQTDLQYALMKCIQEQQALIQSLTTRLTALENK